MSPVLRMLELLEEAFDSGLDPEQCRADNPDLNPELCRELQACQDLSDELDALFPTDFTEFSRTRAGASRSLPDIAGYEVLSVLGTGGMGVVYRARHLALGRLVAIKMVIAGRHSSAIERERIKHEAKSQAGLKHPHIVQVFDVGELDGTPYFTMELMEGESLGERLQGAPQSADYAVSMMITVAGAVEAAHKCGIIHRDLKPGNVLLTADGVPKLSDFGLARKIEGDEHTTLPGSWMGTPSYMAPEQASEKFGKVGRKSDVYALGAILYAMMTGRPPFRGESAADTERQLLQEDVVPPKRLNARLPRDLETIFLKSLQKDPTRRYASAAELVQDLTRWRIGEPIHARRVGRAERCLKWARRTPAAATAIVAGLLLLLGIGGGGLWLASQRAAAAKAVADDVTEAIAFQRQGKWDSAAGALERADSRLRGVGGGGPTWVRDKLTAAERDQQLVAALDKARNDSMPVLNDTADESRSADTYAGVFAQLGIGTVNDDPQAVANRIRASNVKTAIVDALDEWWTCERFGPRADWFAAVACDVDPEPGGLRDRLRHFCQLRMNRTPIDKHAFDDLVGPAELGRQPIILLVAVGAEMNAAGIEPTPYYTRLQQMRPGEFLANYQLAATLANKRDYHRAIEYSRAATALQPRTIRAQFLLELSLAMDGRMDEALANLQNAEARDPAQPYYPLIASIVYLQNKLYAQALATANRAEQLSSPGQTEYLEIQAKALAELGRVDEAVAKDQLVVSLKPSSTQSQSDLRRWLRQLQRLDDAKRAWDRELKLDPASLDEWQEYPELCLYLGDIDAYRHTRTHVLDKFGETLDPRECEQLGRSCLLLPLSPEELGRATALIDRALTTPSTDTRKFRSYFVVSKALADYRAGDYQGALQLVAPGVPAGKSLVPMATLIGAMSHQQLNQKPEALAALRDTALLIDWSPAQAKERERWIYAILRREAERMIIPDFQAFLDDKYQPRSVDECIALTAVCEETNRTAAEARLWSRIFELDPKLTGLYGGKAIHAATLAGVGQGSDAGSLNETDRAAWRDIARKWADIMAGPKDGSAH